MFTIGQVIAVAVVCLFAGAMLGMMLASCCVIAGRYDEEDRGA